MLTGTFDSLKEVMIFGHVLSICAMMLLLRPTLRASRITSGIFETASNITIESNLDSEEEDDSEEENQDEEPEETIEPDDDEEVVESKETVSDEIELVD